MRDVPGLNSVDASNVFKREIAPAIFNGAGAVMPKATCSVETVPDE
jgi:hypothetical protein